MYVFEYLSFINKFTCILFFFQISHVRDIIYLSFSGLGTLNFCSCVLVHLQKNRFTHDFNKLRTPSPLSSPQPHVAPCVLGIVKSCK